MNKTLKANFPAFANLHGGWSNINTSIFYWKVLGCEGFVLGELFSVGLFNKRIGRTLFEMKKMDWRGYKSLMKIGMFEITNLYKTIQNWIDIGRF